MGILAAASGGLLLAGCNTPNGNEMQNGSENKTLNGGDKPGDSSGSEVQPPNTQQTPDDGSLGSPDVEVIEYYFVDPATDIEAVKDNYENILGIRPQITAQAVESIDSDTEGVVIIENEGDIEMLLSGGDLLVSQWLLDVTSTSRQNVDYYNDLLHLATAYSMAQFGNDLNMERIDPSNDPEELTNWGFAILFSEFVTYKNDNAAFFDRLMNIRTNVGYLDLTNLMAVSAHMLNSFGDENGIEDEEQLYLSAAEEIYQHGLEGFFQRILGKELDNTDRERIAKLYTDVLGLDIMSVPGLVHEFRQNYDLGITPSERDLYEELEFAPEIQQETSYGGTSQTARFAELSRKRADSKLERIKSYSRKKRFLDTYNKESSV